MGSVCCCLRAEDFEDYMNSNSNVYRNCLCLGCFVQNFLHVCTTLFQRGEMHSVPSSTEGMASMNTSASPDNSLSDICEKGSSHSQKESEPLRGEDDAGSESLSKGDEWNACEQGSTEQYCKSSQLSSTKGLDGTGYFYSPIEEEDVCPTCLEEYTLENPKIVTKCSHHFHLGCIYEWMERSENCPVCGKVMAFDETI
ncbi:hypothetical protein V6Z11_D07G202200 [Gossypium hirsutum]|uniref:RING-type E3 ubiquitin transferase n=1 Tax=Gossypium hirsutum TaxID=3635 RepID=A0ABM3AFS7_GOSHI|nr:E3 ubiquitin-protein ligase At3g02290-like isoform X2 [Gossypium hirsutum]